jgi:hypothetical protein
MGDGLIKVFDKEVPISKKLRGHFFMGLMSLLQTASAIFADRQSTRYVMAKCVTTMHLK